MSWSVVALRPMRWWDIEPAHQIEEQVFESTAWSLETFWSELAGVPESRVYVVATIGSAVVGYGGARMVSADADIQTLAVAPDARRRGIGQELLDLLTESARSRGCGRIFLEVAATNVAARDLYAHNGFEVHARRSNYYGAGRDALVMLRLLPRSVAP